MWDIRRRRKPPERHSAASVLRATTHVALTALKESSDAFPPLKSAVGGVVHILELCDKVKSNKQECLALWTRVKDVLDLIADAVPDATQISPDLLRRINEFTAILDDIQQYLERLSGRKLRTRLVRHKSDEAMLFDFNRRLDDAFRSFKLISSIKIEMAVKRLEEDSKARELTHETRLDALDGIMEQRHRVTLAGINRAYRTTAVLFS